MCESESESESVQEKKKRKYYRSQNVKRNNKRLKSENPFHLQLSQSPFNNKAATVTSDHLV